jgi:hypothetical protein
MSVRPKYGECALQVTDIESLCDKDIARLIPGFLHNLNSPLCAMTNAIAFTEEDAAQGPCCVNDIRSIQKTADRLTQMVGMMQLLVRDGINGVSELPADQLLDLAVRLVRPLYHAKGGRILLTTNEAEAFLNPEHAGRFLRGMVCLMMDSLEIQNPPPTSTIELTTINGHPNRMLYFNLSCPTLLDLGEVQQSGNRCERLLGNLGGNLSVQSNAVGNARFEGHVPLRTDDGFVD